MSPISEDSLARRVPLSFPAYQRISISSIVACVDIISSQHDFILSELGRVGAEISQVEPVRIRLIAAVWSMIDNYDMLRQLVHGIQKQKPKHFSEFIDQMSTIRLVRNAMDHLSSNVKKIAHEKKNHLPPLHGNLSYTFGKLDENGRLTGIYLCGFAHGLVPSGGVVMMGQTPGPDVSLPVDKIVFHAFGYHLPLVEMYVNLLDFLNKLIPETEALISTWALRTALENGLTVDEVVNEGGALVSSGAAHVTFSRDV